MKGLQVQLVVGSSLCLASLPTVVFANTGHPLGRRLPKQGTNSNGDLASGPSLTPHIFLSHPQGTAKACQAQVVTRFRLPRTQAPPAKAATAGTWMNGDAVHLARWNFSRRLAKPKVKLRYLTVQSGDTLWGISRRYKVPLSSLEQWNHLSVDSTLQTGRKLQLRPPTGVTQTLAEQPPSVGQARVQTTTEASRSSVPTIVQNRGGWAAPAVTPGLYGMQVVQYAERFLGVPYQWGGESPTIGFDCSGFVQFVLRHFGIPVARSSYEQSQAGTAIYQSSLLPGDLVFFDTDGPGASHVGIYVGNQRFISAAGAAVTMNSLTQSYWASHYLGARRIGQS